MRSLRLLHLIQRYYPFQGGSERYFQSISEWFAAAGHTVDVLTTDAWDLEYFWDRSARHSQPLETKHQGVRITRVPVHHLPLARFSHRAIRRLMAESSRAGFPGKLPLLRAGSRFGPWLPELETVATQLGARADLINSANIAFESMITVAERVARRSDVAHVVTPFVHLGEGRSSKVRRYYTMPHQIELLRRADAVIVLTALERDTLIELGVDGRHVQIAGAGIDRARSTGGNGATARASLHETRPLVLALGAAAYDKGTLHLVEAVSRLNRAGTEVALVVAGPILRDFQRFADELSEQDRRNLHVLGFISEDEKRDLLAAADIL
ncbi:MAG TPA: glycosyltransferase family 4 protein, partial [Thermomicrobiaceae bacterium]|nr:glycosyltransferase family 4 protein [Thermomicrobiaceae bacterium]